MSKKELNISDLSDIEREVLEILFPVEDFEADWSPDTLDSIAEVFGQRGLITKWEETNASR